MKLSGIFYDAAGPLPSVDVRFEAARTVLNGVLDSSFASFKTDGDGAYSIDLEPGYYKVTWLSRGRPVFLGNIIADADSIVTLPEALGADLTPIDQQFADDILELMRVESEMSTAAAHAAGESAAAASESANQSESSASASSAAANAAGQSAATATQGADTAAQSALEAGQRSDSASGSAQSASEDAASALSSRDDAANSANAALTSANSSNQNAQSALQSAESAAESQSGASESQVSASLSANAAGQSVDSAAQSASAASDSEGRASAEADRSTERADAAEQSATLASNLADLVAEATVTYTSISEGLAATADTLYFRVIESPEAHRVSVYRNDSGVAAFITDYYTRAGVDESQTVSLRLARSLQRTGDYGQTLHSDFAGGAYGLGSALSGGVDHPVAGEEMWGVQRATPKWVWQPSGPSGEMRLTEVPADTLAREWNSATGEALGVLIEDSRTNLCRSSENDLMGFFAYSNPLAENFINTGAEELGINLYRILSPVGTAGVMYNTNVLAGVSSANSYCLSCIFKPITARRVQLDTMRAGGTGGVLVVFFDADGEITEVTSYGGNTSDYGCTPMGDGFYKLWCIRPVLDTNSTAFNCYSITISSQQEGVRAEALIAGVQPELGNFPSSYIPTNGAPVTRAADTIQRLPPGNLNPQRGTFLIDAKFNYDPNSSSERAVNVIKLNLSSLHFMDLRVKTTGARTGELVLTSRGADAVQTQVGSGINDITPGQRYKIAITYTPTGMQLALDGKVWSMDISQLPDITTVPLELGSAGISTFESFTYLDRAMSEAEIIAITKGDN